MPTSSGPRNSSPSNLVFSIDTYDTSNCVTPLGCGGWNGSTQGIKNILTGITALYQNGLRISNRQFYTAFAIDYPESAYGGDAANRQGITPGYNVRSGGKTYDASRALHLWVWNNDTNTWIPDSYFNGWALSGHCYDSYVGTAQVDIWVNDYNTIKQAFPNCTYIAMGSHRDSFHTSAQYTILRDLGAPSNVDSIIGFSSPEWILVGKPGLGAGNAYGWAFQNYSTNPDQVANMNLSVTPKALGALSFDGTDDYLDISPSSIPTGNEITIEIVAANGNLQVNSIIAGGSGGNQDLSLHLPWSDGNVYWDAGRPFNRIYKYAQPSEYQGNHYWVCTKNAFSGIMKIFLDGNLWHSGGGQTSSIPAMGEVNIGRYTNGSFRGYYYNGNLFVLNVYNKELTQTEITNNYRQYKTRFNLP
jgi:hypothetical protein